MLRWLAALVVIALVVLGGAYLIAGRTAAPQISIDQPVRVVGQSGTLQVTVEAPGARFSALEIAVEQNGRSTRLFSLGTAQQATLTQPDRDRIRIALPFGKKSVPELTAGTARIVVTAARPSFLKLRTLTSRSTRDVQVLLQPPSIAVVSTHHYVNHGGSEMVVYRVTPPDVASGVRVGDIEYPGFAASGAGITSDPSLKVAFFALLYDQDLNTPIVAFARDAAGNEAKTSFMDDVFEKPFKKSNIQLDDRFLQRVVPEIIEHTPELRLQPPANDQELVADFLKENGWLRQQNAETIRTIASTKTAPTRYWSGPFVQLGNSKVEAAFADHRTYFYKGKEIDQQVHLGFDLAVTSRVPVVAANDGTVLHASWLGIYGNCVIIDHGMGVASLYGHLSSFDVKVGDHVRRGQTIGRSGMTGLAGGDHLHFTMLVNGRMVNPVEWWDPHWVADRVERKLREAGATVSPTAR
ncbi:MAG: M23 family metallopeptidase [Betaproteobacteria bacterium]